MQAVEVAYELRDYTDYCLRLKFQVLVLRMMQLFPLCFLLRMRQ